MKKLDILKTAFAQLDELPPNWGIKVLHICAGPLGDPRVSIGTGRGGMTPSGALVLLVGGLAALADEKADDVSAIEITPQCVVIKLGSRIAEVKVNATIKWR